MLKKTQSARQRSGPSVQRCCLRCLADPGHVAGSRRHHRGTQWFAWLMSVEDFFSRRVSIWMGPPSMILLNDGLWYLAYGSNMLASRLRAYLEGSDSGPYGSHRGASDPASPAGDRPVRLNHGVYFAGQSVRWRGPVAFLELVPGKGLSFGRAYLLRWSQALAIISQENGDKVTLSLGELPLVGGYIELPTNGKYNAVLRLDDYSSVPMIALTTSRNLPKGTPTIDYVAAMRQGLLELKSMSEEEIGQYINRLTDT